MGQPMVVKPEKAGSGQESLWQSPTARSTQLCFPEGKEKHR